MAQQLNFSPGDVIFRQHYPGDHAYIVISGEVEIFSEGFSGEEKLAILGPGQMFGELALLDDKPRSASARAVGDVVLQIVEL